MGRIPIGGRGRVLASWLVLAQALLVSCDGERPIPGGFATPEALGRALLEVVAQPDPEKARALFPRDEDVRRVFACDGPVEPLERIRTTRDRLRAQLAASGAAASFHWKGLVAETRTQEVFPAGVPDGDCTPQVALTVLWVELDYEVFEAGQTRRLRMPVLLLQLGSAGPWFLAGY